MRLRGHPGKSTDTVGSEPESTADDKQKRTEDETAQASESDTEDETVKASESDKDDASESSEKLESATAPVDYADDEPKDRRYH